MRVTIGKWTLAAAVVMLPVACSKSKDKADEAVKEAPVSQAAAAQSAPPRARRRDPISDSAKRAGRLRGRPERLLVSALHQLTLTEPQETKLRELEKRISEHRFGDEEGRAFRAALAEGVEAGKVDVLKLEPYLKGIEQAATQQQKAIAAVIDQLHAALEPAQRKTLVAALRKEQEQSPRRMLPGTERATNGKERAKRQTELLARELGLDQKQAQRLEEVDAKSQEGQAFTDFEAIRDDSEKRVSELLDVFEQDSFDAQKLALAPVSPKAARQRAEWELQRAKELVHILTPEQRVKLAERTRRGFSPGDKSTFRRSSAEATPSGDVSP